MHCEIRHCQKPQELCLCSLVAFFVAGFGSRTIVFVQVQSVIIALFTFLESNIKCPTVFYSPTKCSHFKVSTLQLGSKDVFVDKSKNFSLQVVEREKQRQTAGKGAMRIFTPLFEVLIELQGVLNWNKMKTKNPRFLSWHLTEIVQKIYATNSQFLLWNEIIVRLLRLHFQESLTGVSGQRLNSFK